MRDRAAVRFLLALGAVLALSCTAAADEVVASPAVRIWSAGGAVTEGEVTVPGTPAEIYAAVTDYTRWPAIFSNLKRVTVTRGDAIAATVETVNRKGKRQTLVFENDPLAHTVRFEERGGRAVVRARLYADVHGAAGLLVRDSTIRRKRERKVMGDLTRLHAYFSNVAPPR